MAQVLWLAHAVEAGAQTVNEKTLRQLENSSQRLETISRQIELSEARKIELNREIEGLEKDRKSINRQLIDSSGKARKIEQDIDRADERLTELLAGEMEILDSLRSKRSLLAEILAALQRLGKKPPPALLINPDDALNSVRSAALLSAVIPEIRAETGILFSELNQLKLVRNKINSTKATLIGALNRAVEEDTRLKLLLVEKQKIARTARSELANESAKIAEMVANATSLNRLIDTLETRIETVKQAADAARQAETRRKKDEQKRIAEGRQAVEKPDFSDTGRLEPAIAFTSALGLLPKPAQGVQLLSFGQKDRFGTISNGISIATRINARIIAPSDGWVVYSGPFRSYGQLLIINVGSGYHVVLAGLEKSNVQLGQFVLSGEPVGIMGAKRVASAAVTNVGSTRPVLYIEFRKDGKSIDPAPWWSDTARKRTTDDS